MNPTIRHYDSLIEENNDPVYDPEELKVYMDNWDGPDFIAAMQLDCEKTVLEIGVGTGRLALRVAPHCKEFVGIDFSPKTAERARENLKGLSNSRILCVDFTEYVPECKFDVIYSSLTFLHISQKQKAIEKVGQLLTEQGRFVLSIDKNQEQWIDYGNRKIQVFPDGQETTAEYLTRAGMKILNQYETKFAHIFVATPL